MAKSAKTAKNELSPEGKARKELGAKWIKRIEAAGKKEKNWLDDAEKATKAFTAETKGDDGSTLSGDIQQLAGQSHGRWLHRVRRRLWREPDKRLSGILLNPSGLCLRAERRTLTAKELFMFDHAIVAAVEKIAARENLDPAALLAVAEVESGGKIYAVVDGRNEPLIRFEGHYFDRRLSGADQAAARKAGLASSAAGAVANPASQAARWRLLARASEINAQAAFESCSWGAGQVMGAHWEWLGFGSVTELVNLCRSGAAGQIELMAMFINKAGLAGSLRARDWEAFARGYNGPGFRKNAYDTKMAAAYKRWKSGDAVVRASADGTVLKLQQRLVAHGFKVELDGIRGKQTDAALKAFQKTKGLVVDGIAGSVTWAALDAPAPGEAAPEPPVAPKPSTPAEPVTAPAPEPQGWWTWLWSLVFPKGA